MLVATAPTILRHVTQWTRRRRVAPGTRRPAPLLGVTGAPGSGKSTLVEELGRLGTAQGWRSVALSLDDFYLSKAERSRLARERHPLFATRGPPGTHDLAWLMRVLDRLRAGHGALVPRFDKSIDDRAPREAWRELAPEQVELVILEGWCVAVPPEPTAALADPVNDLERLEDPQGSWRRQVNEVLQTSYSELWRRLDFVVALLAPSFDVVFDWRRQQELTLAASFEPVDRRRLLLNEAELRRFLAHFERLTAHALRELPRTVDLAVFLDAERRPRHFESRDPPGPSA